MNRTYQFVHIEHNPYYVPIFESSPLESTTYTVDLRFSEGELRKHTNMFVGKLVEYANANQGKHPDYMFVGYETYRILVAIETQNTGGLVLPNQFCRIEVVVLPNVPPTYLEFGLKEPLKQFQIEHIKQIKGESK